MEFSLISNMKIEFIGGSSKKTKVVSITKIHNSRYPLTLNPLIDEGESTAGLTNGKVDTKPFSEISIELLFGETFLASQMKRKASGRVRTNLSFTSSNTGTLMIELKGMIDVFEGLIKLGENLPPNSLEFTLNVKGFQYDDRDSNSGRSADQNKFFDIFRKGLKLRRNESGSASLEITDIVLPSDNWWTLWRHSKATTFSGEVSVNVKLGIAAVIQLYKNRFGDGGRRALANQVGTPTDLLILVGGNKDKEKGMTCHKSILSEVSPVFAAMFQADMMEAKEGILEIVEFSEPCIRALIEFLYRRNVEEALKSSKIALELLRVAHKYEIKILMEILLHIVWSMPCAWFSADLAVELFFFGKNAGEDLVEAEEKGWAALKWYAATNPEQLMGSKECASLCESPQAAIQFMIQLLNKAK